MPAISHVTKWHHVEDCKISKMTADPAGGTATYASAVDVPGVKDLGITSSFKTQQLRGDNKLLDSQAVLESVSLSFRNAKLSLDALAVMLGGTVTDSGSTPNQIAKYRQMGATTLPAFKLEAVTTGVDVVGGDGHIVFYKCTLSAFDLGFAEEDYRIFGGGAVTSPRIADDWWFDVLENETAVAIS